jgi:hypothetical protein
VGERSVADTVRSAYIIAAVNLAFVPSLYFGQDAAEFYSAVGWGNSALTASLLAYWVTAIGIAVLRPRGAVAEPVTAAH